MNSRHKRVIGIDQVGDEITVHYRTDLRPLLSYLAWAVMIAVVLAVASSCEDKNGLYQGPNDDSPQYRSVRHQPDA